MIHCEACGVVPVPEDQLPVVLPHVEDFRPDGTGRSPLSRDPSFLNTTCPACGGPATRETDVNDNFLDSAWYFFRYPSSERADVVFDPEMTERWLPVDMYVGGNEHAVLHLMYTRFITMAMHDIGLVSFSEPFKKFRAHGTIIRSGAKMSKSRGNVVNPDEYLDRFGADAFRTYLMFLGPYQVGGDFQDAGINGVRRFYDRLWRYATGTDFSEAPVEDPELLALVHGKTRDVTGDMASFQVQHGHRAPDGTAQRPAERVFPSSRSHRTGCFSWPRLSRLSSPRSCGPAWVTWAWSATCPGRSMIRR